MAEEKKNSKKKTKKISKITGFGIKKTKNIGKEFKELVKFRKLKTSLYYKTDASAIVIRRLGEYDAFFKINDDLSREGYRCSRSENIENLPKALGLHVDAGFPGMTLYIYQRMKYQK